MKHFRVKDEDYINLIKIYWSYFWKSLTRKVFLKTLDKKIKLNKRQHAILVILSI